MYTARDNHHTIQTTKAKSDKKLAKILRALGVYIYLYLCCVIGFYGILNRTNNKTYFNPHFACCFIIASIY